jgi:hypothetical protein
MQLVAAEAGLIQWLELLALQVVVVLAQHLTLAVRQFLVKVFLVAQETRTV